MSLFYLNRANSTQLKGIAILLVLLGHTHLIYKGSGGVALFLLLSGYGLTYSYNEKGRNSFWIKKVKKIYLPYLIIIVFQIVTYRIKDTKRILISLLGLDFGLTVDGTMWFLSFLLFFYLCFYLAMIVNDMLKRKLKYDIVLFVILFLSIPLCVFLSERGIWRKGAGTYLYYYYFPIGVLLYYFSRIKVSSTTILITWTATLFLTMSYCCSHINSINGKNEYFLYTFCQAMFWISLFQLSAGSHNYVLSFLGEYSFSIYLFEGFFMNIAYSWLDKISLQVIKHIIVIVISIVVGYCFQHYILGFYQNGRGCQVQKTG